MLILDGVLERHPLLRLIGATNAGSIALLGDRLDIAQSVRHWGPPSADAPPPPATPASELLQRIYADTAVSNPHSLAASVDALGADKVLFGTDSPPLGRSLSTASPPCTCSASTRTRQRACSAETRGAVRTRPGRPAVALPRHDRPRGGLHMKHRSLIVARMLPSDKRRVADAFARRTPAPCPAWWA